MEFPVKVMIVFVLALVVLFILIVFVHQLSGDSRELTVWLVDYVKKLTSIDLLSGRK